MGIENTKTYFYCKKRFGNDEDWPEILENLDEVYHTGIIGNKHNNDGVEDGPLHKAFIWANSPQGHNYWARLQVRGK